MLNYTRRSLLGQSAKTLAGAPLLAGFLAPYVSAATEPPLPQPPTLGPAAPLKLPPFKASSEQEADPPVLPLAPADRVGFAVVGLGNLTVSQILPAFGAARMAKVTALVSGSPDKAKALAAAYGVPTRSIYTYDNFDEIAKNPEVQVVYIVLPNGMHKEYTLRAAKAQKHVLCEKPMANTAAEAQEMIQACKDAGSKLMIAYRQQYEPYNDIIRQMARSDAFGKVKFIEAVNTQVSGKAGQWRLNKALAGGGSLPDVGLYCLNGCRFITGEEPFEIQASIYSTPNDPRFKEVEETVSWTMRFPSGIIANCCSSYGAHEDRRYRFHAERGWFGLDPAFAYRGLRMQTATADSHIELFGNPSITEVDQFAREMDHMASCVRNNRIPHTPGAEGLQDEKIIEAIYEAAATGQVVKLPVVHKLDSTRGANAFNA